MKYFIEDTTLTDISDAVREKEESTQRIPVVELAGRIRDIQTGSTVGKQLNDDGTQNVFVDDTKGDTIDTGRPIASVKYNNVDMELVGGSGEISITTNGTHDVKKYATANVNVVSSPVLLWTNAVPTNSFAAQALTMPDGYDGYFIEMAGYATSGYYYIQFFSRSASQLFTVSQTDGISSTRSTRAVNISGTVIDFGNAYYNTSSTNNNYALPTRIWGVKFTL